jgi:hypothetical protein
LAKAEIPAIVANQYTILDKCAIAFSRQFYQALAGGLPIERAVSAGRIAVYNAEREGRDWGVPVLYLRAADGRLFTGAADPQSRDRCKLAAEVDVNVRASIVKSGGVLFGAEVHRMIDGKLAVAVKVGTVEGKVTGFSADEVGGGEVHAQVNVEEVGPGGIVHGAKIETLGGSHSGRQATRSRKPRTPLSKRARGTSKRFETKSNVDVGTVRGGEVVGTQIKRSSDTIHGDQVRVSQGGEASFNTGIRAENLQIGSVTFVQGAKAQLGVNSRPHEGAIEEKLRLDVAFPKSAVVNEQFYVVVAVSQPDAPTLRVADLEQVVSKEGKIFRAAEEDLVRYRIEVTGGGFQVTPPSYLLKLRPKQNSEPVAFQVAASGPGKRSLLVNAYQEDGALAAQTRLTIEVSIAVSP